MDELSIALVFINSLSNLSNVKDYVLNFRDTRLRCRQKVFSSPLAVLNYIKRYRGEIVGFYRVIDGPNYYDYEILLRDGDLMRLLVGVNENA